MAKVVGPLHSSEARGSVGSLTYNTWRGISIVKARTGPTIQYSDAQVALRALTANVTAAWQAATDAQRAAWDQYANNHLDIDWTGNPQRITGYNWAVRINVRRQLLGQPIEPVPPTYVIDIGLTDLEAEPTNGNIVIYWDLYPFTPPPQLLVEFYGTPAHSPGC
ncbi:MAG: hypothetical protein KAX80_05400, partial [Planctomycetes bacterium]|nr:hypothetical protein [Planctomycetota bacterium]